MHILIGLLVTFWTVIFIAMTAFAFVLVVLALLNRKFKDILIFVALGAMPFSLYLLLQMVVY